MRERAAAARTLVSRGSELKPDESPRAFSALLREQGDSVRRDVFTLLPPEATEGGSMHAGFTIVYPRCSTSGHAHEDREEIYYFIRGVGVMEVDGEPTEVSAGDTFYLPPGPHHTTRNTGDFPLEFFWVTNRIAE